MDENTYAVYIMTNRNRTVLYTGVTNDLKRRVWEHTNKVDPGSFAARYNLDKLVFFQVTSDVIGAIEFEKQIKAGSRKKKITLIEGINPEWKDLSQNL